MKIKTNSDQETMAFAKQFAATLKSGDIICLHGDLGAGKTTFVKGLAEGLGITDSITSPTFTLMNIYKSSNLQSSITRLVHIDTYRLATENELLEIGVEDYLGMPGTITLIEWPEKLTSLLQNKKVTNITIDHLDTTSRVITTS